MVTQSIHDVMTEFYSIWKVFLATSTTPQLKVVHVYWRYFCCHSSCRGIRSSIFWVVMQHMFVLFVRLFWRAYQLHLQGLSIPRKILLEILGGCLYAWANNYHHTLCNKPTRAWTSSTPRRIFFFTR